MLFYSAPANILEVEFDSNNLVPLFPPIFINNLVEHNSILLNNQIYGSCKYFIISTSFVSQQIVCHTDKVASRRLRDHFSRPGGLGRCQTGLAAYLCDTEVVIALSYQCHSIISMH